MANDRKDLDEFGETMPGVAARPAYVTGRMTNRQAASLFIGLALLLAGLAGMWTALQANGQIMGVFAFNGVNTTLALVAGVMALYAATVRGASRTIWTVLALVYAVIAVVGAFMGGNQVFGLLANNYNNVWMSGAIALLFAYLATTEEPA